MILGRLYAVIGESLKSFRRSGFICRMFNLDFIKPVAGGVLRLKVVTKGICVECCFPSNFNVAALGMEYGVTFIYLFFYDTLTISSGNEFRFHVKMLFL